jgi:hypothetical protein
MSRAPRSSIVCPSTDPSSSSAVSIRVVRVRHSCRRSADTDRSTGWSAGCAGGTGTPSTSTDSVRVARQVPPGATVTSQASTSGYAVPVGSASMTTSRSLSPRTNAKRSAPFPHVRSSCPGVGAADPVRLPFTANRSAKSASTWNSTRAEIGTLP